MRPDKEVKKWFKAEASRDPDRYYATAVLKAEGYERRQCACGTWYWSADPEKKTCDDAACSGGFRFFSDNPAREPLDYVETWKRFKALFEKLGYTPIDRYPVIARWRDDTDFVQGSIYDFQPFVVSGEVDPPANPLIVPQFSLRFNDVDNVGVTMSHMTGFVMIGQHTFQPAAKWDQDKVFRDIYTWLREGIGLPKKEITFHEDAWAGGGNYGPCIEFFSRGCELGNQVYMRFEQGVDGDKELPLKVLDMGMGHERVCWFTQGKGTIYDAAFPTVMEKLYDRTNVSYDESLVQRYLPFAAYLNVDEIDDVETTWDKVAKEMGMSPDGLRTFIMPLAALYSVAEHARSLLVALSDGGLPSNVGGGYNLRVILRRALRFIDRYGWDVSLPEIARWHAEYLEPLFPELSEHLGDVERILEHERVKFLESRTRHEQLVKRLVSEGEELSVNRLVELYDSQGVAPEDLARAAKEVGVTVKVPDNFYSLVAERHVSKPQSTATVREERFDLGDVPSTEALYFDHYDYVDFEGTVVKVIDDDKVVLDRSAFYPTSGGQVHDLGSLGGVAVKDVIKQAVPDGMVIIHVLESPFPGKVGEVVQGLIDFDRRLQLAQHHTATHILTGAARRVLGDHVWQAGAAKTPEKSRLDITHYEQLSDEEVAAIEKLANEVIAEDRPVYKSFMARDVAESEYGFRLYQGGAVPGKRLRIVNVSGFDVEACGGTHLDVTGDVGTLRILKASKISDGVVRLEFVAGAAGKKALSAQSSVIDACLSLVDADDATLLPARAAELFRKWKLAKKGKLDELVFESDDRYDGDVLAKTSEVLKTQVEHIPKTLQRFKDDILKRLS